MKFFRVLMAVNMVLAKLSEAAADGTITVKEMAEMVGLIANAAGFTGIVIETGEELEPMSHQEQARIAPKALAMGERLPRM